MLKAFASAIRANATVEPEGYYICAYGSNCSDWQRAYYYEYASGGTLKRLFIRCGC